MTKNNPNTGATYRDRFNPIQDNEDWTQVLFKEGVYIQGAELNEVQSVVTNRLGRVISRLIPDSSLLSGGELTEFTDSVTGLIGYNIREATVKYFSTIFRVPLRNLILQGSASSPGTYTIGVLLTRQYLTANQDPELYQEDNTTAGFGTEGADREFWDVIWTFRVEGTLIPGFTQPPELIDIDTNPDKFFFPVFGIPRLGNNDLDDRRDVCCDFDLAEDEISDNFITSGFEIAVQDSYGISLARTGGPAKHLEQDLDYLNLIIEPGVGTISGRRVLLADRTNLNIRRALAERLQVNERLDVIDLLDVFPKKEFYVCLGVTIDDAITSLDTNLLTIDIDCDVYNRDINFVFELENVPLKLGIDNSVTYQDARIRLNYLSEAEKLPKDNAAAKELLRSILIDSYSLLPNQISQEMSYQAFDSLGNELTIGEDISINDIKECMFDNFLLRPSNVIDPILIRNIPSFIVYSRRFGQEGLDVKARFYTLNNENITYSTTQGDNLIGLELRPAIPVSRKPLSKLKKVQAAIKTRLVIERSINSDVDDPGINQRVLDVSGVFIIFDESRLYEPIADYRITSDGKINWSGSVQSPIPGTNYVIYYSTLRELEPAAARQNSAFDIELITGNNLRLNNPKDNIIGIKSIRKGNNLLQLDLDYNLRPDRTGIELEKDYINETIDLDYNYVTLTKDGEYLALNQYEDDVQIQVKRVINQFSDKYQSDNVASRIADPRNSYELLDVKLFNLDNYFLSDYYYYLNREDLLYLDTRGNLNIISGKSEYQRFIEVTLNRNILPIAKVQLPADSTAKDIIVKRYAAKALTPVELGSLYERVKEIESKLIKTTLQQDAIQVLPYSAALCNLSSDPFLDASNVDYSDRAISSLDSRLVPLSTQSSLQLPSILTLQESSPDINIDDARSYIDKSSWGKVFTLPFNTYIADSQPRANNALAVQPSTLSNNPTIGFIKPCIDEWLDYVTSNINANRVANGYSAASDLIPRQIQVFNLLRHRQTEDSDKLYFPWLDEVKYLNQADDSTIVSRLTPAQGTKEYARLTALDMTDKITSDISLLRPRLIRFSVKGFLPNESIRVRFGGYDLPCFGDGSTQQGWVPDVPFSLEAILLSVRPQGYDFNYDDLTKRDTRAYTYLSRAWTGIPATDSNSTTCFISNQVPSYDILNFFQKRTILDIYGRSDTDRRVKEVVKGLAPDFELFTNNTGTVLANELGEAQGFFYIPALLIPAGRRPIEFWGNQESYLLEHYLGFPQIDRVRALPNQAQPISLFKKQVDTFSSIEQIKPNDTETWDVISGKCIAVNNENAPYSSLEECQLNIAVVSPQLPEEPAPILLANQYIIPILQKHKATNIFELPNNNLEFQLNSIAKSINQYTIESIAPRSEYIESNTLTARLVPSYSHNDVVTYKLVIKGELITKYSNRSDLLRIIGNTPNPQLPEIVVTLRDNELGGNQAPYIINIKLDNIFNEELESKQSQSATAIAVVAPLPLKKQFQVSRLPNPISQTFTLQRRTAIRSIRIAFTKIPDLSSSTVKLELRNTIAGFPGDIIYGTAYLNSLEIECLEPLTGEVSVPEYTTLTFFDEPIVVNPYVTYSMVLTASSPDFEVAVFENDSVDVFNNQTVTGLSALPDALNTTRLNNLYISTRGANWNLVPNQKLTYEIVACNFYGLQPGIIERSTIEAIPIAGNVVEPDNVDGFEGALTLRGLGYQHSQAFVPAHYSTFSKTNLNCQHVGIKDGCLPQITNIKYNQLNLLDAEYETYYIRHLFYGRAGIAPVLAKDSAVVVTGLFASSANYITKEVIIDADLPFNNVRLTIDEHLPAESNINYSISIDGGNTWIRADNTSGPNGEITQSFLDTTAPLTSLQSTEFKTRVCRWELAPTFIYDQNLRQFLIQNFAQSAGFDQFFRQAAGYARKYKIRITGTSNSSLYTPILRNLRLIAYDNNPSTRMLDAIAGKVKINSNDPKSSFLQDKLVAGDGIKLTQISAEPGLPPEFIEISLSDLGVPNDISFGGNLTVGTAQNPRQILVNGFVSSPIVDDGRGPAAGWNVNLLTGETRKRVVIESGQFPQPTGMVSNSKIVLIVTQDCPSGQVQIQWPENFKFPGGIVPQLSQEPGAIDILRGFFDSCGTDCDEDGVWYVELLKNFTR